jgi:hypothetical protein
MLRTSSDQRPHHTYHQGLHELRDLNLRMTASVGRDRMRWENP